VSENTTVSPFPPHLAGFGVADERLHQRSRKCGGNVEGSVPGEVVRIGNAQVWGGRNVPSQMPGPASRLYAQNIVNLVTLMTGEDHEGTAAFAPDFDDEIVSSSCVTRDGVIVHAPTREAIEVLPAPRRTAEPEPAYDEGTDGPDAPEHDDAAGQPFDDQLDLPYDQEADQ